MKLMIRFLLLILTVGFSNFAIGDTIIWDSTHGCKHNSSPSGKYKALADFLETQKISVMLNENEALSDAKAKILVLTVWVEKPYTADDVAKIKEFTQQGGGLLVLCDTKEPTTHSNINSIIKNFGIQCGVDDLYAENLKLVPVADQKIFKGNAIPIDGNVSAIKINTPATIIGRDNIQKDNLMAVSEISCGGRVLVVGDSTFLTNGFIDKTHRGSDDILQFVKDIFHWLLEKRNDASCIPAKTTLTADCKHLEGAVSDRPAECTYNVEQYNSNISRLRKSYGEFSQEIKYQYRNETYVHKLSDMGKEVILPSGSCDSNQRDKLTLMLNEIKGLIQPVKNKKQEIAGLSECIPYDINAAEQNYCLQKNNPKQKEHIRELFRKSVAGYEQAQRTLESLEEDISKHLLMLINICTDLYEKNEACHAIAKQEFSLPNCEN